MGRFRQIWLEVRLCGEPLCFERYPLWLMVDPGLLKRPKGDRNRQTGWSYLYRWLYRNNKSCPASTLQLPWLRFFRVFPPSCSEVAASPALHSRMAASPFCCESKLRRDHSRFKSQKASQSYPPPPPLRQNSAWGGVFFFCAGGVSPRGGNILI